MGILLQIIGVISVIISLVYSILMLISGTYKPQSIIFLVLGVVLIRLGRIIYNFSKKK